MAKLDLQSISNHVAGWEHDLKHVSEIVNTLERKVQLGNGSITQKYGKISQFSSIHDIVDSGSTLICAGPADLGQAHTSSNINGGVRIVPIGLIDMAQISMNRPLNRLFEIGSRLSYIVPGKTVGGMSLNRVFFDGPSLMKMLYAGEVIRDSYDGKKGLKRVTFSEDAVAYDKNGSKDNTNLVHDFSPIGSNNIAMNLFSDFFSAPFGLAVYFRDQSKQNVGAIYFEGCRISSYSMGIQAQMTVLQESVNIEFVNCRPIVSLESNTRNIVLSSVTDVPIIGIAPQLPPIKIPFR